MEYYPGQRFDEWLKLPYMRVERKENRMSKLDELAEQYGFPGAFEMLEESAIDSVVPAICMNPDCDYTTDMEPDQDQGWCEACESNTVKSCLVLAGVV